MSVIEICQSKTFVTIGIRLISMVSITVPVLLNTNPFITRVFAAPSAPCLNSDTVRAEPRRTILVTTKADMMHNGKTNTAKVKATIRSTHLLSVRLSQLSLQTVSRILAIHKRKPTTTTAFNALIPPANEVRSGNQQQTDVITDVTIIKSQTAKILRAYALSIDAILLIILQR